MKKLAALLLWLCLGSAAANAASPAIDGNSGWQGVAGNANLVLTLTTSNANDLIIVYTSPNGGDNLVRSITDTAGLTWQLRKTNNGSADAEEWFARSSGALTGDTITIHYASNTNGAGGIAFGVSAAVFASGIDPGTSTGPTTQGTGGVSVTTLLPDDLIVGMYRFTISSPTVGAGFTALVSPTGTFNMIEYQSVSATQSGLSVGIGTGSGNVNGGMADAFTSDVDTNARASKINSYGILNAGTASAESVSKIDTYPILNAGNAGAMSASKMNAYIVLKAIPQKTVPLFHSFPP